MTCRSGATRMGASCDRVANKGVCLEGASRLQVMPDVGPIGGLE